MMKNKIYYTLWKANRNNDDDAILLDEEGTFKKQYDAFTRANKLAGELVYDWGFVILVREIIEGSNECKQWTFSPRP